MEIIAFAFKNLRLTTTDFLMRVAEAFAHVLRATRVEAELTQAELAALAGLHANFVSRLELASAQPTLETLFALARAFGCQPQELVQRTVELGTTYRRSPGPEVAKASVKRKPGRPPKPPSGS